MRFRLPQISAAGLLLMLVGSAILSCSDSSPTRIGRPPVVNGFSPETRLLNASVGDTLRFSITAFDPDREPLEGWFSLNDSLVGHGTKWRYVVEDTGLVRVTGVVDDGEYSARIVWTLSRVKAVNLPPAITDVSPLEPNPSMIIFNSLHFAIRASDPERRPLTYQFTVDDSLVANDDEYTFLPTRQGTFQVRGRVYDGELSTAHGWNVRVTGVPDTIPPALVLLTNVETGTNPGEVDVEWIAVGKDNMTGTASEYFVRTSPAPILSETDWSRASDHPYVPLALPAGSAMQMTLRSLQPGVHTHLAVRAVDDFGNLSPLGETPGVFTRGMHVTGRVRDAMTLVPLEGVEVRFALRRVTTASDGTFELAELQRLDNTVSLQDEDVKGEVGAYYDFSMPYSVVHQDHLELYLIPDQPLTTTRYTDFYQYFRTMTDVSGIPPFSQQRRWQLPIDLYIPPLTYGGLDYADAIREVALELDAILGVQVFNFVSAAPTVGVRIVYRDDIFADNFGVEEWEPNWYPRKARIEHRLVYSASTRRALQEVARHELGHAVGLNHSSDPRHVMIGGQSPSAQAFTDDEQAVIRVRYHLPRGLDVRFYGVE